VAFIHEILILIIIMFIHYYGYYASTKNTLWILGLIGPTSAYLKWDRLTLDPLNLGDFRQFS